jgi:hypothetical protein
VPLLAGVFLRDLQLDADVRVFQAAKQWRHRFAHLKVDRTILDLYDYIFIKFAVQGMKDIVGGFGPVVFQVRPIEMVVVDEGAVEDDSAMWL